MKPNEEIAIGGGITSETCDGGHIKSEGLQAEVLRNQIQDMLDEPVGGR